MISLEYIIDLLRDRSNDQLAQVVAYLIAPLLVLGLAVAGVYTPGLGLDFGKPIAVSSLYTEIGTDGRITEKQGIALTVEPTGSEFHLPLDTASTMWMSIKPEIARANSGRLSLTPKGMNGTWPLIGVNAPVTVVIQAKPGSEILLPGGKDRLDALQRQSRRYLSFVSSVLLSCFFAFGMSLATAFPSRDQYKHARGEKRANPDENKVVERHTIKTRPRRIWILPHPQPDGEEVPRVRDHGNN